MYVRWKVSLDNRRQGINASMMLAISYILGQDAQISLERLTEIHQMKEENALSEVFMMPEKADLVLQNVSFRYGDKTAPWVLKNINLAIPHQKVTAIVGASGSGKTTLLKLLLKVYEPEEGKITLDNTDLKNISSTVCHDLCGAVMQDGFIFGDTIAKNIAMGVETIEKSRLLKAVEIANVRETIEKLPMNYNTKIGAVGVGLSQGQKQRILIARAVYKNPEYLFFDEATSALDANNEKAITQKLNEYLQGKTTVIIAHRLSTVREADQIIVLENGEIAEIGNHDSLVALKGKYYELVRNQLELGN